ncbi:MAG: hypothetical protein Q9168_005793, partial [Polycauliona sp. 1 TL-2023]
VSTLITDASDLSQKEIFELLYARLACLTLLNQTALAGKESLALGDIHSPFYVSEDSGECIIPWELRVLVVRLQALEAGDAKGGIQGYYDLAAYARMRIKSSNDADVKTLWRKRLRDLGIRVGNALIENGDLEAGRRHFGALAQATSDLEEKTALSSWIAMLCLRMGDLEAARSWTANLQSSDIDSSSSAKRKELLEPLLNMANGDYESAVIEWRALLDGEYAVLAKQNLAVCLLYTGHLTETTTLLESLINTNHAFHALTFNLATVYELSSDKSRDRKMQLAERVAAGLRRNEGGAGVEVGVEGRRVERGNVEFKL